MVFLLQKIVIIKGVGGNFNGYVYGIGGNSFTALYLYSNSLSCIY